MKKIYLKNVSKRISKMQKRYNIMHYNKHLNTFFEIAKKSILSKMDKLLFGNIHHFIENKNTEDNVVHHTYPPLSLNKKGFKNNLFYQLNKKEIVEILKELNFKEECANGKELYLFSYSNKYTPNIKSIDEKKYFHTEKIICKAKDKHEFESNINIFSENKKEIEKSEFIFSLLIGEKAIGFKVLTKYEQFCGYRILVLTYDENMYIDMNKKYIKNIDIHLTNITSNRTLINVEDYDSIYEEKYFLYLHNRFSEYITNFIYDIKFERNLKTVELSLLYYMIYKYTKSFKIDTKKFNIRNDYLIGFSNYSISDKKYYELPYFKAIENKIDDMIEYDNGYSNFIINGDGGTGKTFYLKNILPKKYDNKISFITISGEYVDENIERAKNEEEKKENETKSHNYFKSLWSTHTDKLRYLRDCIQNILPDLYNLKKIPICLVWDEFENVILSLGNADENTLLIKEILDKVNELEIPVFFIFLTNDYKRITDKTLYRRGRIDYPIDINNDVYVGIDTIINENLGYFKNWLKRNNKTINERYKINDLSFIEKCLKRISKAVTEEKKDIICQHIYVDITGKKEDL